MSNYKTLCKVGDVQWQCVYGHEYLFEEACMYDRLGM